MTDTQDDARGVERHKRRLADLRERVARWSAAPGDGSGYRVTVPLPELRAALAAIDRLSQPAPSEERAREVPDGWVLVPVEPTPEMLEAGEYAAWDHANAMPAIRAHAVAWSAMLAAAPTPPAPSEEDVHRVARALKECNRGQPPSWTAAARAAIAALTGSAGR